MEYSGFLSIRFAKWQNPSSSTRIVGFLPYSDMIILRIHPSIGFGASPRKKGLWTRRGYTKGVFALRHLLYIDWRGKKIPEKSNEHCGFFSNYPTPKFSDHYWRFLISRKREPILSRVETHLLSDPSDLCTSFIRQLTYNHEHSWFFFFHKPPRAE